MKIQDFIDGGFYINLDYRTDKNEFMINQLKSLNLQNIINRFSAIKILNSIEYTREDTNKMLDISIATANSHKSVIKIAKEKGWKNILILEDDAFFYDTKSYKSLDFIENSLDELFKIKDWEIYYLGANLCDDILYYYSKHLIKCDCCFSTHAYILNERVYDNILNTNFDKFHENAMDIFLSRIFTNKYISSKPVVIQKEGFLSDIGGHMSMNKNFWISQYDNKKIIEL
jgi:GR25 family glycosyltransferase involved in LPS biosynthesis